MHDLGWFKQGQNLPVWAASRVVRNLTRRVCIHNVQMCDCVALACYGLLCAQHMHSHDQVMMDTKTLDNTSMAAQSTGLAVSPQRLRVLEPGLAGWRGRLFNFRLSLGQGQRVSALEAFEEHLRHGDAGPALVLDTNPVRVAAYANELDAVVMLTFEAHALEGMVLSEGDRLLCVCTYEPAGETPGYAADIIPGPRSSGHFRNAAPLIADFLSEAHTHIELIKGAFEPAIWAHVESLAHQHQEYFGAKARPGNPISVCFDA